MINKFLLSLKNKSIRTRLVKGTFWSFLGTLFLRGSNLIAFIIIARLLGKEGFGEFGIIQSTLAMLGIFAGFGLGLTNVKYIAEYKLINKEKVGRVIAISNIMALLFGSLSMVGLVLLSKWLASEILNAPHLASYLIILSPSLIFMALLGAQNGVFAGFEEYRLLAIVNLINSFFSFPILLVLTYFFQLKGLVFAQLIISLINWSINIYFIKKLLIKNNIDLSFKNLKKELKIIWNFSLPTFLNSLLVMPVNWTCNAMLVNQQNGYEEMGIYNAANQWYNAILIFPTLIGQIVIVLLAEQISLRNFEKNKSITYKLIKYNFLVVGSIVIVLSLGSKFIMSLYGQDFESAHYVLIIVLMTALFQIVQIPIANLIAAANKMWVGLIMNFIWAITFIITSYYLVVFGAFGIASARLIAYLALFMLSILFLFKYFKKVKIFNAFK